MWRRSALTFSRACCEVHHMRAKDLTLIRGEVRAVSGSKDRTDENAPTGLLVVQVRHLGTVLRKISETAPALIHLRSDNLIPLGPRRPPPVASRYRAGKVAQGPRGRLKPINKVNGTTVIVRR